MSSRDGGKGDRRRKLVVPEEQFNANWDAIFGKKKAEWDPYEYMCPNCVSPWKCNGPHIESEENNDAA